MPANTKTQNRAVAYDSRDTATICRNYKIDRVFDSIAGNKVDAGFEAEISRDIEARTGHISMGYQIPDCILLNAFNKKAKRSAWGVANGGANLVPSLYEECGIVDALVAESILGKLGVRTITSRFPGSIHIPKSTGESRTGYWVDTEGGNVAETAPSYSSIVAGYHTCGGYFDLTRKIITQTAEGMKEYLLNELIGIVSREIEKAFFAGTGTSGQPTGIDNLTGVEALSFTAGAPTASELLAAWKQIAANNVHPDRMSWACPTNVYATLAGVEHTGGERALHDGKLAGTPIHASNLATAKKLYLGDFSTALICSYSGIEIMKDETANGHVTDGGARFVALTDLDIVFTQPKAVGAGVVLE